MSKKKLIPQLRFPEFQTEEEWVKRKIEDVAFSESSSMALNKLELKSHGYPVYGADSIVGYIDGFQQNEKYISFVKDGSGVGRLKLCQGQSSILGTLACVKSKNEKRYQLEWIYYLLNKIDFSVYIKGAGIPHIYFSDFKKENIPVPKPKEQQKIAACLSSLDELITAESQKLDALKDHKKGLLQNLFPAEGETIPQLRFPEFENDGEWEKKTLGEIGKPLMCKRILKEQTTQDPNNSVPFYKIGTFGKVPDAYISIELYQEYKRKFSFPNFGDILISASGTIGRLVVFDGNDSYYQDSNIIWLGHDEKNVINPFLYFCYSILHWQTSDGGVISRLYNSDFNQMKIVFPRNKNEQQKIAACLSSLDEQINEQSMRVDELKAYKKGLMKQLFPEVNE